MVSQSQAAVLDASVFRAFCWEVSIILFQISHLTAILTLGRRLINVLDTYRFRV
jgi:hypothetical protein